MNSSAIPSVDMNALLADPEVTKKAPLQPLEEALKDIKPEEAKATAQDGVSFQFRSLLSKEQQKALTESAPAVADRMIKDYSQILNFGTPVMERMNQASIAMLKEQRNIKLPEADQIVNNLLRELDGYSAKYRNVKLENFTQKVKKLFGGTTYSIKTMIRDSKPISSRLDEAEVKVREMELDLEQNALRARTLHTQTLETMNDVVAVLASLEEITDHLRKRFTQADALLLAAGEEEQTITFEGQKYSLSEFKEFHADLAQGLSEIEKSWFSWRQQFFLGFASAPTLRNLILVSASMQRRLLVFRTQGIPSARRGLAMWQQSALAKQGAALGENIAKGTNSMIQGSFEASADAVKTVAMASQAPVITEDTVFAVIDSVKNQVESLIEADKWGRDMRARNLSALERGETEIAQIDAEGRRQMAANATGAASNKSKSASKESDQDILSRLGVK